MSISDISERGLQAHKKGRNRQDCFVVEQEAFGTEQQSHVIGRPSGSIQQRCDARARAPAAGGRDRPTCG